jgi:hypothetical protein
MWQSATTAVPDHISVPASLQPRFAQRATGLLERYSGLRSSCSVAAPMATLFWTTTVCWGRPSTKLDDAGLVMVGSPGVGVQHATDLHLDGVPPDQR